jgi:hypothetical protein
MSAAAQAAPQTFYFSCAGGAKVQNGPSGKYGPWTASAPAKNFSDGGGCTWLDSSLSGATQPNPFYDAQFGGTYDGEVKKLSFTLFASTAYDPVNIAARQIVAHLLVDGKDLTGTAGLTMSAVPQPGPDAATQKLTYTISGLDLPATKSRTFVIAVAKSYANDMAAWLLGAKEYPSSVTFYGFGDLTCEEQQAYNPTVACDE